MRVPPWLRRYGLDECELPTMLANVDVFLRPMTLRVDTRNEEPIFPVYYILSAVAIASYFYVYLICMAISVYDCSTSGEVLPALIVFSLGVSSEIGSTKLACLFFNESKAREIVKASLAADALVEPGSRFHTNLVTTLRVVKRRAVIFWSILIVDGLLYIIQPLFMSGRHLMEDDFALFGLEPRFESPNYEVAYFVMAMGVVYTVYIPANVTAYLIITAGYVEAQILAWSEELIQLWDDAEKDYMKNATDPNVLEFISKDDDGDNINLNERLVKDKAMNAFVRKRLITIAIGHSKNIEILAQLEKLFRVAIAVEFSLLGIALIAELLGGLENTYMEVPYAMLQVAMDCLTGQRLKDASQVLERAVYASRWERLDRRNMRLVLAVLQTSQRPLRLTAGGVTTLDFTSLMSVFNSVYSAYTTLRSTMK